MTHHMECVAILEPVAVRTMPPHPEIAAFLTTLPPPPGPFNAFYLRQPRRPGGPAEWDPQVPLVRLNCERHSLGRPVAAYVREAAATEPGVRVTVLIPETEPERLWQRLLQNQRGAVAAHAVRRETNAVIRRLRFRLL